MRVQPVREEYRLSVEGINFICEKQSIEVFSNFLPCPQETDFRDRAMECRLIICEELLD